MMYIIASHTVSPSYNNSINREEQLYLKMEEQDFSDLFEKNEMRRLTKLIKNGVGCGLRVLKKSGIDEFGAIITGTGKGSISKIEQFLSDIDTYKETALNPGIFIQSTHNTINGQLALKTGRNTYNMTHVNQGYTVDNVLTDSALFLKEYPYDKVLAGVFEENTDFNVKIHNDAELRNSKDSDGNKIIWGESISFFILSSKGQKGDVKINSKTYSNLDGCDHWSIMNGNFKSDLSSSESTIFLLGFNNDKEKSGIYGSLVEKLDKNKTPYYNFKSRCGEHDTASGYAIDLGYSILRNEKTDEFSLSNYGFKRVIIVNHFKDYICQLIELELQD